MGGRSGDGGLFCAVAPFLFFGESCQVLPMSDEAMGGDVERVKEGKDEQEKVGCPFQVMGARGPGLGTKMGGWVRNAVECGKN